MQSAILAQINIILAILLAICAGVYVSLRFRHVERGFSNIFPSNNNEHIRKKVISFRDSTVYKLGTQQLKDMITRQFMPPIITRV